MSAQENEIISIIFASPRITADAGKISGPPGNRVENRIAASVRRNRFISPRFSFLIIISRFYSGFLGWKSGLIFSGVQKRRREVLENILCYHAPHEWDYFPKEDG